MAQKYQNLVSLSTFYVATADSCVGRELRLSSSSRWRGRVPFIIGLVNAELRSAPYGSSSVALPNATKKDLVAQVFNLPK